MSYKVFIEIPSNGNVKYELDEKTGELEVSRFLFTAFNYPFNYGFIKDTLGEDGDPVDTVILSTGPIHPGAVIECHPLGVLDMEDEEGKDVKVISVPEKKIDPFYGFYNTLNDVSESNLKRIKHFFDNYKTLEEGKWTKTGNFMSRDIAEEIIKKARVKFEQQKG